MTVHIIMGYNIHVPKMLARQFLTDLLIFENV